MCIEALCSCKELREMGEEWQDYLKENEARPFDKIRTSALGRSSAFDRLRLL